jgi:hypothetical protein
MDTRNEIRDFLTSRRAKITPEQAGLPAYGASRRVAGLRREEVALLAGVSVDYYTRLERGNARTCSTWPGPPAPRPRRGHLAAPPVSRSARRCSASSIR